MSYDALLDSFQQSILFICNDRGFMSDSRIISEAKLLAFHQMGVKLDDLLEQNKKNLHIAEGSLNQIAAIVMKSKRYLEQLDNKDTDTGYSDSEIESFKKLFKPLLTTLEQSQVQSDMLYRQLQGKVQMNEMTVAEVKQFFDAENVRLERIKFLEEHPEAVIESPLERVPGTHPGKPLESRKVKPKKIVAKKKVK